MTTSKIRVGSALAICAGLMSHSAGAVSQSVDNTWTQMNILEERNVNGNDYMTSTSYGEYTANLGLGQIFYIPSNQNNSIPFYRLSNGGDHMDSSTAGEGGYSTELVLGYPYLNSNDVPGLNNIARFSNGSDHATASNLFTINGYYQEGPFNLYGYQRYFTNNITVPYQDGGITEESDTVAGGAIKTWTWNGVQFINSDDYGRYMQADFFYYDHDNDQIGQVHNPIEAGDNSSNPSGSPTLINQVVNGVHITRAIPLEYFCCQDAFFDRPNQSVDLDHVYVYTGSQIGKNLTLNYNGLGPVAQYETHFIVPENILAHDYSAELVSAYLLSIFSNFYTYDAPSNQLLPANLSDQVPCGNATTPEGKFTPPSGYGGVIVSKPDLSAAIGVYGLLNTVGGPISYFQLDDTRVQGCGNSTKFSAWATNTGLTAGDNVFHTYIVTGTIQDVVAQMYTLWQQGAH